MVSKSVSVAATPKLRDYQDEFVENIRKQFARGVRRVLGVASTGAGKTVCFSYIATGTVKRGNEVVIVAHRNKIVEQISRALTSFGVEHGVIDGKAGKRPTAHAVQVAMVSTLISRLKRDPKWLPEPSLLVIDEAHHTPAGAWNKLIAAWPGAFLLGVTATPIRKDGKPLDDFFDVIVEAPPMSYLIEKKYLSKYVYLAPDQKVDLSAVKTRAGDYAADQVADAMDQRSITGDAVDHYSRYLNGRPAIAFCCSIAHAEHVAAQFREAGWRAASVSGTMALDEQDRLIASIGDGRLNVLTSCDLISEGTDIPAVAGAILLRPTESLGLHLQQVGRVLRLKEDGSDAIILDHVGNVHRHGLPDSERQWSLTEKNKKREITTEVCAVCFRAFDTVPGWKGTDKCAQGAPDGCIMIPETAEQIAERMLPELIAGELALITEQKKQRIDYLRTTPLSILMQEAHTIEQLQEVAKARGYKSGWVFKVMEERKHARRAA